MPNLNKVLLIGHLTRDPEMRYLPNNTPVTGFGIAVSRKWKGKDGQQQEEVCFIDCEVFGPSAEFVQKYFTKGKAAFVDGRLKLDQWEDKSGGGKRSKLKVIAENVQFAEGKAKQDDQAGDAVGKTAKHQDSKPPFSDRDYTKSPPDDRDDDIPF